MIDINKIYNEDCLETMKRMPDEFIDLVVTSPPYGTLRDYKGFTYKFFNTANHLRRVLKPGGVIVWVESDEVIEGSETGQSFSHALYFKEIGLRLHDTMVYMQPGFSFPESTRYPQVFQYMFIISKGKPKAFNPIKDRQNRYAGEKFHGTQRQKDGTTSPHVSSIRLQKINNFYGVRFNIWSYNTGKNNSYEEPYVAEHPATFPEQLANDHIISWSNEGDLVYDPFMGSGTTAKMAIKRNRNFLGSEIAEEYCTLANKRINAVKMQEVLF